MNTLSKILIILTLIIVVTGIIIIKYQKIETHSKNSTQDLSIFDKERKENETIKNKKEPLNNVHLGKKKVTKEVFKDRVQTVKSSLKKATGDVLAIVEGDEITKKELKSQYKKLLPKYQDMFKNNKDGYLEQLISRKILVQKATEKGYIADDNSSKSKEEAGIQKLISDIVNEIDIPESDIKQFYQENKGQMRGAPYEQVKNDIRNYLLQQKQDELTQQYIEEISKEADVTLNEDWIAEQLAAKPKNPLTDALQNKLPTVLDLGSEMCIPCKKMIPIFAELEKELAGKANVILLQIDDYRDLASKYNVRVIPTQIFFDKNGEQYWRHEGFLSKEDILAKLKETGAEL